jgi:hypothetical protein
MFAKILNPIVATCALVGALAIALVLVVPMNSSQAKAGSPEMRAAVPLVVAAVASQTQNAEMAWADLHRLAVAFDVAAYSTACGTPSVGIRGEVIAVAGVVTLAGDDIPPGAHLDSPRLVGGIVLTLEDADLYVGNDFVREVVKDELVVVGANSITGADACAVGCSVTCGEGYYACCNEGWFTDTCKCIANGTTPAPSCDHGGPGSTGCSTAASD